MVLIIRFMRIFAGFPGYVAVIETGVVECGDFQFFLFAVSLQGRDKAKLITIL